MTLHVSTETHRAGEVSSTRLHGPRWPFGTSPDLHSVSLDFICGLPLPLPGFQDHCCIWPYHPQLGEPTLFPVSGEAVFSWPLTSFLSLHHIHACPSCGLLVPRLRTGTLGCLFSPPFSLSLKSCHHTVPFAGAVMSLVA